MAKDASITYSQMLKTGLTLLKKGRKQRIGAEVVPGTKED